MSRNFFPPCRKFDAFFASAGIYWLVVFLWRQRFPGKTFIEASSQALDTADVYWPETASGRAYRIFSKGAETMPDYTDPWGDLDDLIFDQDDGGPSER